MLGSAGTGDIWPRDPEGAHLAQASPELSCASRAYRDVAGQGSPDDTWQSFQAHNGLSTVLGSLSEEL